MNIDQELLKWREERGITHENQKPGLVSNVLEEMTELSRSSDLLNVIDALLDISIFLANAIPEVSLDVEFTEKEQQDIKSHRHKFEDNKPINIVLKNYLIAVTMEILNAALVISLPATTVEEEKEIEANKIKDAIHKANCYIKYIMSFIEMQGLDSKKCLEEVMKQIHTRKGKWDENIHKFVKDTTQTDVYQADFLKCII